MVHERPVGEWARLRTTTLGPAAQRPLPRKGSEVAGSRRAGPTPQMKAPGLAGEKNIDVRMSPIPNRGSAPATRGGWLNSGAITRAVRFRPRD
jgi:hypothetical protein